MKNISLNHPVHNMRQPHISNLSGKASCNVNTKTLLIHVQNSEKLFGYVSLIGRIIIPTYVFIMCYFIEYDPREHAIKPYVELPFVERRISVNSIFA